MDENQGRTCPRCGKHSMEIDWDKGKAKCTECGHEIAFQK